jgi:hypothetical protein
MMRLPIFEEAGAAGGPGEIQLEQEITKTADLGPDRISASLSTTSVGGSRSRSQLKVELAGGSRNGRRYQASDDDLEVTKPGPGWNGYEQIT